MFPCQPLKDPTIEMKDNDPFARVLVQGDRKIGYALAVPPQKEDRTTAIVYFYPLSGCSLIVQHMDLSNYQCSFLCVDRPDCGETSSLEACPKDKDFGVHRIQGHAQDVLAVLRHEKIQTVYVLGVCLGHVYAVELCRQLLMLKESSAAPAASLKGLTLVAPFVSTAAPESWWVARLGASVPSSILYGFTETAASVGTFLVPKLLQPSTLQRLVTEEEQKEFGWTETDFEQACGIAIASNEKTERSRAIEARLGASPTWQTEICDKFAIESGCGLMMDEPTRKTAQSSNPVVPIRIYISEQDKLVSVASVKWIAERCYGGSDKITIVDKIHSHEVMTFLGGPPKNPVLLHEIALEWGLRSNFEV